MYPNNLKLLIENKRNELHMIVHKHGLNSSDAIKNSQDLDRLINEYNDQSRNKQN